MTLRKLLDRLIWILPLCILLMGAVTLVEPTVIGGDFRVTDDAEFQGDVDIDGDLEVVGSLTTAGISGGTLSGTSLTVDEDDGDAITGIYTGQGAVDSGSSSVTITVTGAASGDIAMANSITTGIGAYIASAVAGTDEVVVTLSGNASTTSTIDVVVFGR